MAFQRICSVEDLWEGEMKAFTLGRVKLLLVHLEKRIIAYENRCLHQSVELSSGGLNGSVLTCVAHQWQYDLLTGQGLNPKGICLKSYPTKIESGDILVDLGRN